MDSRLIGLLLRRDEGLISLSPDSPASSTEGVESGSTKGSKAGAPTTDDACVTGTRRRRHGQYVATALDQGTGATSEAITSTARSQTRCRPTASANASVNDLSTVSATSTPAASRSIPAAASAAVPSPQAETGLQCRNTSCSNTISLMSRVGFVPAATTTRVVLDGPRGQQCSLDDDAAPAGLRAHPRGVRSPAGSHRGAGSTAPTW